jgi:hypothetical protein
MKNRKKAMREKESKKGLIAKLMPIIYVKGSCFETPLYDHVPGNKRDGDKDRV